MDLETVSIKNELGEEAIINQADYDPSVHVLFNAPAAPPAPAPAPATDAPPAGGDQTSTNPSDAAKPPVFGSDEAAAAAVEAGLVPADFAGKTGTGKEGAFVKADVAAIAAAKAEAGH
jgi:pyruvate/2-oxoglutarate dehydrogenase complex dihydrolipoamide acyltransferase (E2) component